MLCRAAYYINMDVDIPIYKVVKGRKHVNQSLVSNLLIQMMSVDDNYDDDDDAAITRPRELLVLLRSCSAPQHDHVTKSSKHCTLTFP